MGHLRRLQDVKRSTWPTVGIHDVHMRRMYVRQSGQSSEQCQKRKASSGAVKIW